MLSLLLNNCKTEYSDMLLICLCCLLINCSAYSTFAQLVNGDFETSANTVGYLPDDYGYWQGDVSEITGNDRGISPYENNLMLRFINATMFGPSSSVGSELWQIIDVSPWYNEIVSGKAQTSASGYFNRITGDAETDTSFSISLYAYAGLPGTFPLQWNNSEIAHASGTLISDDNPVSWEMSEVLLHLPEITDFVVIRISATEDIFNDLTGDEFDGHFADNVQLRVIPGPASILLLTIALVLCASSRRFKRVI